MIEIAEIFGSLQGEGPFMGRPAVFIRLSRCMPPFCPWCDTPEAWGPGKPMGIEEIMEKTGTFNTNFAVITGGEPFLQWETGLHFLEQRLIRMGYAIQYETSGKTRIPSDSEGFKVCSPKFLDGKWRFPAENAGQADAFKFVVNHDVDQVGRFVRRYGIPDHKVWIMPFGATRSDQLERLQRTWRYCVANNYNFAPRLHILAFDTKKGI